eukprot:GHVP01033144.1.p1 GENE.GHVP01033144.1~~GHVP01033144.1.p1  ORF type:complete len:632 (-),score=89.93 GHVP01033144.1:1240-3135(-)
MQDAFLTQGRNHDFSSIIAPIKILYIKDLNTDQGASVFVWLHAAAWTQGVFRLKEAIAFSTPNDLKISLATIQQAFVEDLLIAETEEISLMSLPSIASFELIGRKAARAVTSVLSPVEKLNNSNQIKIIKGLRNQENISCPLGACMSVRCYPPKVLGPLPSSVVSLKKILNLPESQESSPGALPSWSIEWPSDVLTEEPFTFEIPDNELSKIRYDRRSIKRKSSAHMLRLLEERIKKRRQKKAEIKHKPKKQKNEPTSLLNYVPILLSFAPGVHNREPPSVMFVMKKGQWSSDFWCYLNRIGCLARGMKNRLKFDLTCSRPTFPFNGYTDSAAGHVSEGTAAKEREEIHAKKPTNRRPNYDLLAVQSPFSLNWSLIKTCNEQPSNVRVLRGNALCNYFRDLVLLRSQEENNINLVPVFIEPVSKGVPQDMAMLYCPTAEELENYFLPIIKKLMAMPLSSEPRNVNHARIFLEGKFTGKLKEGSKPKPFYEINPAVRRGLKKQRRVLKELKRRSISDQDMRILGNPLLTEEDKFENQEKKKLAGYISNGNHCLLRGKGYGMGYLGSETLQQIYNQQTCILSHYGLKYSWTGTETFFPPNIVISRLRLFAWFRNIHEQTYHLAWLGIPPSFYV